MTRPHPHLQRCGIPWQSRIAPPPAHPQQRGLDRFNALSHDAAVAALLACCGCRRWAERIAAHRPYPDPGSLLAAGDEAGYDLTAAEVAGALARESAAPLPRAERGPGTRAAATALRAAHAEYERRFRHVFTLCLDGYGDEELLDRTLYALRTRLGNAPDQERSVTAEELRRLARGRLARLAANCR
ncbi:2-oxo-4-hydroxy-4-carboxy-5-ureidoimidazoline decarboxylase [Streptomyces sp. CT34]|uniref:2-oxo-4-hydroxy-4-carboxy-5-ureidoimidazoline decarboxylase n=1 Tax=Streptomyces sp. CT34 TaxID=1553907 RepID=UPI00099D69CC|nr:2-oxo-4-hydroxy-4-carboxy-5-ureidoimidazoline decarboxylase [Streptomyces sp. CT34]